jgi:beta-lactamase class A
LAHTRRRTARWLREHRQFVRRGLLALAALALVSVLTQLFYPAGRLLPFVKIQNQGVGGKTVTDATKQLDKAYVEARVMLKTADKMFTKSLDEIGIEPKNWDTARTAAHYPVALRFVPFSSIFIMIHRDTPMQVKVDDQRLHYFAQQVEKEGFVQAVNASVKVEGSKVAIIPSKPSKAYPANTVARALEATRYAPKTTVRIKPQTKPAERTDDEVKSLLADAQRAVDTPLTLKLDKEDIPVDETTVGSWLDFLEDAATKKLQLGLKADVVKKYLESIQSKIYKAPGETKVQIIDGREVGRTTGQPGRGIDADKTVILLHDALTKGQKTTVTVPIVDLPPKLAYVRTYSNGDAGLTALLGDLARSRNIGISVMELGGRSGNVNGDKKFVAASTYKLFVAYAVFKEIEAGRMSWGDPINGSTVERCFDAMIVKSDNLCALALGDRIGWQNIENQMGGLGLNNTELSPALYTTAKDLSLFLYRLENGTLVSAADKTRLVDAMKRQIYRAGIPAGTGLTVADKVGFIDSYIHDAGIVYGARGPYVLVIMTSGSSWSAIADAARQINNFLGN